jgi:hypothetical protein
MFTQWPIDANLDHQAASILTFRAWLAARGRFELYYYEVALGMQTMGFHPTDHINIFAVRERKKAALCIEALLRQSRSLAARFALKLGSTVTMTSVLATPRSSNPPLLFSITYRTPPNWVLVTGQNPSGSRYLRCGPQQSPAARSCACGHILTRTGSPQVRKG